MPFSALAHCVVKCLSLLYRPAWRKINQETAQNTPLVARPLHVSRAGSTFQQPAS
jgi:hypothetical protein